MPNLYCVRADYGTYTKNFLEGCYIAIGWLSETNLSQIKSREELYPIYKKYHPDDTSNVVIGQQVGQIARFLLEIQAGDYVIVPDPNTDIFHYGVVLENAYFYAHESNGCPFLHRKNVKWHSEPVQRSDFSVPFQNTIRSSLTVFKINHENHFFSTIGKNELISNQEKQLEYDYYKTILEKILQLDDKEFEILITHILEALGFEGAEHQGRVGDGGVDATGELNVANLAKIKLFVQAKRYKLGAKINANTVKALRSNIPSGGQGAFITTADYQSKAKEIAVEYGFPRIGLVNGNQLVDILAENWEQIPEDFKDKLGLKTGLVVNV